MNRSSRLYRQRQLYRNRIRAANIPTQNSGGGGGGGEQEAEEEEEDEEAEEEAGPEGAVAASAGGGGGGGGPNVINKLLELGGQAAQIYTDVQQNKQNQDLGKFNRLQHQLDLSSSKRDQHDAGIYFGKNNLNAVFFSPQGYTGGGNLLILTMQS